MSLAIAAPVHLRADVEPPARFPLRCPDNRRRGKRVTRSLRERVPGSGMTHEPLVRFGQYVAVRVFPAVIRGKICLDSTLTKIKWVRRKHIVAHRAMLAETAFLVTDEALTAYASRSTKSFKTFTRFQREEVFCEP